MKPVVGDHLGEDADDLIGDLRALRRPRVFIISGPSGVGKDAVIEQLRERFPEAFFAVTATTRERRPGEIDGVHYFFLGEDDFRERLAEGEFLESATVYGNLYGVLKGLCARRWREVRTSSSRSTYRAPPRSSASCPARCQSSCRPSRRRRCCSGSSIARPTIRQELMTRFATATRELAAAPNFDYVVFNKQDRLEDALNEIAAVVRAESCRTNQEEIHL